MNGYLPSPRRAAACTLAGIMIAGAIVATGANGAVAEAPVCNTDVSESAPVYGAAATRTEPTTVSAVRNQVKVRTTKVRRVGKARWKARVVVRATIVAHARRAHVVAVPAEVTAQATTTCGERAVTSVRTVPAQPVVRTGSYATAKRVHRDSAVKRAHTRAGAVRAARKAAMKGWGPPARHAAVRKLAGQSSEEAWVRARDAAYALASHRAVQEAVTVVETELSAAQPA